MGFPTTFLLNGEDTGATYSVMRQEIPAGMGPSFLHSHPASEGIYVLDGEFEIYSQENGTKVAGRLEAGAHAYLPGREPHGLKCVGNTPGHLLLVFTPPGSQERFFRELGSRQPPIDPAWLDDVARRHELVLLERP